MATARKCDRCGKFYSLEDKKFVDEDDDIVMGVKYVVKLDLSSRIFDLCDDCAEELFKFLHIEGGRRER